MGILLAFVIIGIVVISVPVSLISEGLWYLRLRERNKLMQELAREFSLTYHAGLPSFLKYYITIIFKDLRINFLEGLINGHKVVINDMCYAMIKNLIIYNRRQTLIELDGEPVKGSLKSFTLGSKIYFASIPELKDYLGKLRV